MLLRSRRTSAAAAAACCFCRSTLEFRLRSGGNIFNCLLPRDNSTNCTKHNAAAWTTWLQGTWYAMLDTTVCTLSSLAFCTNNQHRASRKVAAAGGLQPPRHVRVRRIEVAQAGSGVVECRARVHVHKIDGRAVRPRPRQACTKRVAVL